MWIVIIVVALIALAVLALALNLRCPSCKQFFALREQGRQETGHEQIWKRETKSKFVNGKSSSYEVNVPYNRTYYRVAYVCSKCGHKVLKNEQKESISR
jgi:DNA-directed RNA polymerase subunit RPC12/RpoP